MNEPFLRHWFKHHGEVRGRIFLDIALFGYARQLFLETPDLGLLISRTLRLRKLRHPCVQSFGADPEPISNFFDPVPTLRNLSHRVDLELVGVLNLP